MRFTNLLMMFLFSTAAAASLDGRFETKCLSYSQNKAFKNEVEIKGQDFSSKFFLYDDKKCQNLLLVVDYSSEINYPTAIDLGPMDHKIKSALMIVFDADIVKKLNTDKLCGKTVVRVGSPLSVAGMAYCGPLSIPAKGEVIFDMYQKTGSSISFGAHPLLWVRQEEKRPVLTSRVQYRSK